MKEKKGKIIKTVVKATVFGGAVIWLVNFLFATSYTEIMRQMLHTSKEGIAVLVLLETGFILMDSVTISLFVKRYRQNYSYGEGLQVLLYGNFYKGITFGSGTKVAQIYLLNTQNVPAGVSSGILTMQYVFHRTAIIISSIVMVFIFRPLALLDVKMYKSLFFIGFAVNFVIILMLVLICIWKRFHDLLLLLIENVLKHLRKERYVYEVRKYFIELEKESHFLLEDGFWCIRVIVINCMKLLFCYAIPYVAYISIIGKQPGADLMETMTLTAVMTLLVGAIPAPVGMGSTEVAYLMVFTALFGELTAGTTMIIYRLFTYYFPFLLSTLFMIGYQHMERKRREEKKVKVKEEYTGRNGLDSF